MQSCTVSNFDFLYLSSIDGFIFFAQICGEIYSFHNNASGPCFNLIVIVHQTCQVKKSKHSSLASKVLQIYDDQGVGRR